MFLVPARFIFGGPPLFFYICYWKSLNELNPTFVTALAPISLLLSSVTGLTFHLRNHLLNTQSY